jgi:hypothetical protein
VREEGGLVEEDRVEGGSLEEGEGEKFKCR